MDRLAAKRGMVSLPLPVRAEMHGAIRRSASRSAASAPASSSHSRAVSSSSSSTAIAAAGVSCHTFGPSRSSITARIGVPLLAVRAIALRHRVGHRRIARPVVGDQRHVADLHHEVRRDRRHISGFAHTARLSATVCVLWVWMTQRASGSNAGRAVDARGARPASCWRDRRTAAGLARRPRPARAGSRKPRQASVGVIRKPSSSAHADVAGRRMHVAAREQARPTRQTSSRSLRLMSLLQQRRTLW